MGQDKLPGLQIARAFAAIGIAYFHSWHVTMSFPPDTAYPIPILRDHGWISVDFFFAISGFVICLVITSPKFSPFSFAIRRAFRLYPLWIATSLIYLYLTRYVGRAPTQTNGFFLFSLTLLPTNGFPFYDLGWSLQHEIAFYLLAALVTPLLGIWGLIGSLCLGIAADHLTALPWYLHQYFFYYGDFLAGIAAFLVYKKTARVGFILPMLLAVAELSVTQRALYPIGLFFALIGFLNLRMDSPIGRFGTLLGDASYSIYLIHPLVFTYIYASLHDPLPPIWIQEPLRYGAILIVCTLAVLSWKLFETPMNHLGGKLASLRLPRSAIRPI